MSDPKQGEREYFSRIGPDGLAHSLRKPFVPQQAGLYLANLSALLQVLPPPPLRILDVGCGTGWLGLRLAECGYDVTGIDISADAIAAAQQEAARRNLSNVSFATADYESFAAPTPFDAVLFYDALHHAESELAALKAAYAALRDGGVVITIEPGVGHSTSPESLEAVRNYGVHEKDMPPSRILDVARAVGFRRHLVLPRPFDVSRTFYRPVYHRCSSHRDLYGRVLMAVIRLLPRLWRRDQGMVLLWK